VNSIRARKDLIVRWLEHRENDIDVLCLQEIKVTEKDFPFGDFERLGFSCEINGQKGYNGVAICSKIPLENVRRGFSDDYWDRQKRTICGRVLGINFINVYVPHGGLRGTAKYDYKLGWFNKFAGFLDQSYSPSGKIVIVGDFNVARSDLDVYNPEVMEDGIGTMAEEREGLNRILDWGLVDVFRHLHPQERLFTWWDYITGAIWRNEGMRIDYVLCTEPLIGKVTDAQIDLWPRRRRTPKPSDHAPAIVTLGAGANS
jgi:exodeoxyribonuclease-3